MAGKLENMKIPVLALNAEDDPFQVYIFGKDLQKFVFHSDVTIFFNSQETAFQKKKQPTQKTLQSSLQLMEGILDSWKEYYPQGTSFFGKPALIL